MSTNIVKATEIAAAYNYPENHLGKREQKVLQVAEQYAPTTPANWGSTPPDTITEALDLVASAGAGSQYGMATATAVYDFSVNGGGTGTIDLGVAIPDNAIIVETIRDELVACTSTSSTGTIILNVATDGNLEQTALTCDGGAVTLASSGGSAVPKKTTAARTLRVTIATNNILAGKIRYFVRYMKSE